MEYLSIDDINKLKPRLTEDEFLELLYFNYPSTWIEEFLPNPQDLDLPLSLRSYQKQIINSHSKKRVIKMGRQMGKCLDKNAIIHLGDGSYSTIEELYKKHGENGLFRILSFNEKTLQLEIKDAVINDNSIKDTIKISTRSGNEAIRTLNHPYYVWRDNWNKPQWIDAGDLKIGDRIATIKSLVNIKYDNKNNSIFNKNDAMLLGLLIGDGGLTGPTPRFTSETNELPMLIENIISVEAYNNVVRKSNAKYQYTLPILDRKGNSKTITNLLKKAKLYLKNSHEKRVPLEIMTAPSEIISSFLGGIWATDGYITISTSTSIGICLCNQELIKEIQLLLLKLGIKSKIRYKSIKYNNGRNDSYCLELFDAENIMKFNQHIHIPLKYKQDVLHHVCNAFDTKLINSKYNTFPKGIWNYIHNIQNKKGISNASLLGQYGCIRNNERIRTQYSPNYRKIERLNSNLHDEYIENLLKSDIYWDIISELESTGIRQTYNIMVPENHTLVADNFIEHNSTVIQLLILFYGLKVPNSKILVVGPQKTHVEEIFNEVENLISRNAYLKSLISSKRQPLQFTFKCGTKKNRALFLTTGEDSGGKGLGIRGKTTNVLIVDEADYINDDVMEQVVIPTTNSYSDPIIILSSTPSGRRGFFRNSWDSGFFSTFHFKSSESPAWTTEKEQQIRASTTKRTYALEYDADWAESEAGLFSKADMEMITQLSFIPFNLSASSEGIKRQYSVRDDGATLNEIIKPKRRILGVDWNKAKNGVRLVWCDFDEQHNMWLRQKWKIDQADFTQNAAIAKIIELHSALHFDLIMVDVGYGSMQIEDLHLYGLQHPETKLDKIVKGVETDSQIEITDIASGNKRKTYIKNFIVESMVRFVEQHRIRVPVEENLLTERKAKDHYSMFDEMAEYCIEKYTANGRPVYSGKNSDHDLDAFMFTLYGYLTEVIKSQDLWYALPKAKSKTISFDALMKNRTGKPINNLKQSKDEKEIEEPARKCIPKQIYRNTDSYTHRSLNRFGNSPHNQFRRSFGKGSLPRRSLR